MTGHKGAAIATVMSLLLAVSLSSCSNFLDVNQDPNNPQTVGVELQLPGMLMAFGEEVLGIREQRYGNLMGPAAWGSQWTQQWAWNWDQNSYSDFLRYEVSNQDTNGFWQAGYHDVMQQCLNIMAASAKTKQWDYHGIAKFMFAWTASELTDAFGPIPFSQAFDLSVSAPKYDTQQQVYDSVFTLIDQSIAEMQKGSSKPPPSMGDVVYHGDMTKWIKLAETVKARLELRLAYAPGESAADRAQKALTALASGYQSAADEAIVHYPGGAGGRNPWYWFGDPGNNEAGTAYEYASAYWVNLLKSLNDPRLPITVQPALSDGQFRGHMNGYPAEPDSTISKIGTFFTSDSADFTWVSYSDAKFNEAEARLITSGAAAADAAYREGIRANMEKLGVAPADIATYLAARPSLGSVANPLKEIITQKYITNYLRTEAWNDWRRTGYPVVPEPVPQAVLPGIPQRLRTPADAVLYNAEQVAATGIPTTLQGMMTKVWWASGSQGH